MSTGLTSVETSDDDPIKCAICCKDVVHPVLLICLHSACRSCTGGDVSHSVTCPRCNVTTDKPTGKVNLLISSLAHRAQIFQNVFLCEQCTENDKKGAVAVTWCYTCQYSLCVDCQDCQSILHHTHKMMHLNEHTNFSDLYLPPARSCKKHAEELKLACFTCKDGRCYMCAHDCYTSSHEVLPLDSPDALKRMEDTLTSATRVLDEVNSALTPLQSHLNLTDKVLHAREGHLSMLKKTKNTAIDSISLAYENAAKSLLECWDSLVTTSVPYLEKAECIKSRVFWTNKYCKMALNSNDIAGVLPQLDEIVSCLQTLRKEARQFEKPVEPSELVRFNTWLPSDLDLIASGWFGKATVVKDDFKGSPKDLCENDGNDYYKRKVSTLQDLELLLLSQKQQQTIVQREREVFAKMQSELTVKDQKLCAIQNDVKKLLEQQQNQQEQLELERRTVQQLQLELTSRAKQLAETQSGAKRLFDQRTELLVQLERERRTVMTLQSEFRSKSLKLDSQKEDLKRCFLYTPREPQEQFHQKLRAVQQFPSAVVSETQQLVMMTYHPNHLTPQQTSCFPSASKGVAEQTETVTPTTTLSFDSSTRRTFLGPGVCWDVAVTPQDRLLVAAMADGLKEYDAISFREIATWKPTSLQLGHEKRYLVRTVDVLTDDRAVVGLDHGLVVLLRCNMISVSCARSADEAWRAERFVAGLQAPPRRLSAWGDNLVAVLEDRRDEITSSWRCGPGLVLLSLRGDDKQVYRQQLDYDAHSVALTDRCIIVASSSQVELTDAASCGRGKRKWNAVEGTGRSYVVDCYSHLGIRLWRHAMGATSLWTDSVGRVLYAAKNGSVVAQSIDDGRELSTSITLSTSDNESVYALSMNKWTPRLLAIILLDGSGTPNIISTFSIA